jgi:hypothetical protein
MQKEAMARGSGLKKCRGKHESGAVESNAENPIFENQIVPVWASTKVAAAMLGISPNALRIRKCRGQIQSRYFGNHLRFNVSELQSQFREERQITKGAGNGH